MTPEWYDAFIQQWADKEKEACRKKLRDYHADPEDVLSILARSAGAMQSSFWHAWLAKYAQHAGALDADTPMDVRKMRLADLLGYCFLGLALCELAGEKDSLD